MSSLQDWILTDFQYRNSYSKINNYAPNKKYQPEKTCNLISIFSEHIVYSMETAAKETGHENYLPNLRKHAILF